MGLIFVVVVDDDDDVVAVLVVVVLVVLLPPIRADRCRLRALENELVLAAPLI